MQSTRFVLLTAALCACGDAATLTKPEGPEPPAPAAQYDISRVSSFGVSKLNSLGGTQSSGNSITSRDWIAGFSSLAGDQTDHAALWRNGSIIDLGTLGGPNSSVLWPGQNDNGVVVGISETSAMDTIGERWSCSAFFPNVTHHICRGFVWENGSMRELPTLGGENGFATGVNNRGQVVGWAETPVHDPTCNAPQVLQFRAVMWGPRRGQWEGPMTQLRPWPGDSTSAATAINDRGQVVGISGDCNVAVGKFSARHAVMWDHGTVTNLGTLGGVAWNTPMDINESGDVVGFSDPPGDANGSFIAHAFLWTKKHGIKDLGVLPGDQISQALGINSRGQIVGESCGATCRAVMWTNGTIVDLNPLVTPVSADTLIAAQHINDAGEITGQLLEHATGKAVTFIATPRNGNH